MWAETIGVVLFALLLLAMAGRGPKQPPDPPHRSGPGSPGY